MTDDLDLLGTKGAAIIAKCDRATILRAIQRGELKAKLVPAMFNRPWWGIDQADLDKWIAQRKRNKEAHSAQKK